MAASERFVAGRIASNRSALNRRVARKRGVWGTSLGLKVTNGVSTDELCLTVLVDKKLPTTKLSGRSECIPKITRIGTAKIQTDVVEVGRLVKQSGPPEAIEQGTAIFDGKELGTLSSLVIDRLGNALGLSCAHTLMGADEDYQTPDPVEVFAEGGWNPLGHTSKSFYYTGPGVGGDFGFFDAGLITLENPAIRDDSLQRSTRAVYAAPQTLEEARGFLGMKVLGIGARTDVPLEAQVDQVWVEAVSGSSFRADLVIREPNGAGLTRGGDSGMLWTDADGVAVAIHAMGEETANGASPISVCMFADRAATQLSVTLLA